MACICCQEPTLHIVTVSDFQKFVHETGYVTDAEKYGWSIVQQDILNFQVLSGIDWRCPTGLQEALEGDPVLQVSYNDAYAYALWADGTIPNYETYWDIVAHDDRLVNKGTTRILPLDQVNIVGNTWEITSPDPYGQIRLAGGSHLCDEVTCNGISPDRQLFVDVTTGNSHIGFAIIKK